MATCSLPAMAAYAGGTLYAAVLDAVPNSRMKDGCWCWQSSTCSRIYRLPHLFLLPSAASVEPPLAFITRHSPLPHRAGRFITLAPAILHMRCLDWTVITPRFFLLYDFHLCKTRNWRTTQTRNYGKAPGARCICVYIPFHHLLARSIFFPARTTSTLLPATLQTDMLCLREGSAAVLDRAFIWQTVLRERCLRSTGTVAAGHTCAGTFDGTAVDWTADAFVETTWAFWGRTLV